MTQRHALLSVSDKTGIVDFAKGLVELGFTILSTGGTGRALAEGGIDVVKVSDHTGHPEIMNGRVKTLHPRIHGGILGDRVDHAEEAAGLGIPFIDLVAVNLYPFEQSIMGKADVDLRQAIEKIDIGGPTMVRAAAKNCAHVTVVVDPSDYGRVLDGLRAADADALAQLRLELSARAFRHTARYDSVISTWVAEKSGAPALPGEGAIGLKKLQDCRYGENPHQRAAFFADVQQQGRSLARATQHQGRELSFNNIADADGAIRAVFDLPQPGCCIVKHMNPCGLATAERPDEAFRQALAGDPVSAYGGIVAFNRPVGPDDVRALRQSRTFFEVLAAPGFTGDALQRLEGRKKLRVLELPGDWAASRPPGMDARRVQGGWLLQDWDLGAEITWKVAGERQPTADEERALRFAWIASRHVKSNAIVLACAHPEGARLCGVGAGQMSRVDAVKLSIMKATAPTAGAVLASDAFFPFADGIEVAAEAGVTAIIQPGGSIRDEEVVAAADKHGIAMVFTGVRHFRH